MSKKRFNAEDWLTLGLAELSRAGPEAVKLDAICKAAELTKGSFYYHFADHQSFLVGMAERWLVEQTDQIADQVAALTEQGDFGPDVMQQMTDAAIGIDYKLELSMRELGRRVPDVNAVIAKADHKRIGVLSKIYQVRYNQPADLAARLAYLEYAAFSGIVLLNPDMPEAEQRGFASLYEEIITSALGKGA